MVCLMISGVLEVYLFAQIYLILDVKLEKILKFLKSVGFFRKAD